MSFLGLCGDSGEWNWQCLCEEFRSVFLCVGWCKCEEGFIKVGSCRKVAQTQACHVSRPALDFRHMEQIALHLQTRNSGCFGTAQFDSVVRQHNSFLVYTSATSEPTKEGSEYPVFA